MRVRPPAAIIAAVVSDVIGEAAVAAAVALTAVADTRAHLTAVHTVR